MGVPCQQQMMSYILTQLLWHVQLVNYAQFTQTVALRIRNSPVPISPVGNITLLTGLDYRSTNSFEDPYNVSPSKTLRILSEFESCEGGACLLSSASSLLSRQDFRSGDELAGHTPYTA